jgi:DNA-binding NtrC family response regulator
VRELIGNLLVENGYTVLTADHGEAAIDVSQRYYQSIDLLLTDVIMPGGMTGLQLAEKLRRQRPNMRILYMSGYMDNAISLQAMKNPSLSFLQKPFALDVLAHKVRQVLDQDVR